MSGRMVKRVLQEQKPAPSAVAPDDGTDSEDDRNQAQHQPVRNMFDLLGSQASATLHFLFQFRSFNQPSPQVLPHSSFGVLER
jgi:hypothetical protein